MGTVTDQGADYVLALKQNQPQLHNDVTEMFDHAKRSGFSDLDHHFSETVEKGHGRIEKRRCWAISDPDYLDYVNDRNQWSGLKSLAMVESERTENGATSTPDPLLYIESAERCSEAAVQCENALGDRELSPLGVGRSVR